MVEVRALHAGDEAAYAAFLRGRPDALLYQSLPYRDLLVELLGSEAEYLLALEGGEIRGVLPAMWRRGVLNSLPYYGSHGDVLAASEPAREALLAAWDERATDPATAAATLIANPFGAPHRDPVHDMTDERLNQALPLAGIHGEPSVLARAEPSAARNLRKARRSGYAVAREPDALGELAAIHTDNLGPAAKRPAFFAAVPRHFTDYTVYTARLDGALAAGLLVFWAGAAAEYYTPAVAHVHRSGQPLAAILVQAILDAAQRGLRWFNFGGTWPANDGLRRFKRKWGARAVSYRYFTKVNDRELLTASPDELRERFGGFYVLPFAT